MNIKRFVFALVALALVSVLSLGLVMSQQPLSPRKSSEMTLNGKKISLDYGAPSVRGRKIFGGEVVKYDTVWRLGANKATHFMTEADLMIENASVPKGTYTLYALPSAGGWKLIINKQTGQWGTVYDQAQDLARINMKVAKTTAPVEQMNLTVAASGKGGKLTMEWENTSASVSFTEKK